MVSVRQFVARMAKTFFVTTAIDYTNSPPHIGHAYEKVLADVIARYHRLKGEKVFFLTGVDQHGQKVQQSAAKAGVPPANSSKASRKSLSICGRNSTSDMMIGQKPPVTVTRKSFKEFCNAFSMPAKSTRTNRPVITQFARNNS